MSEKDLSFKNVGLSQGFLKDMNDEHRLRQNHRCLDNTNIPYDTEACQGILQQDKYLGQS